MKVRFLQSLDLGVTLAVCVGWLVPRLVAECHHHHHHHGECEVGYGEVEDEDEDGLCVDPGLENGGEGGQDDQQIEQGLGNELDDGQSVKTGPHCLPHCAQPQGLARLKTYNVKKKLSNSLILTFRSSTTRLMLRMSADWSLGSVISLCEL